MATTRDTNKPSILSNDLYRRMIEEVEDYAIILLDREGFIQTWNKGAQKIKLYSEAEALGRHFRMFYQPEAAATGVPETLLEQAATEGKAIHEGWRIRKDGSRFWGSITLTAIHDDNGQTIAFTKVTRDLTERKQAEDRLQHVTDALKKSYEALRKSEEEYHKMVEEVEDYAIILLNEKGDIQNWNTGAEKIKGYRAEEILGKHFRLFYLPSDRASGLPERLIATAKATGKATHEGWRVRKNGGTFWGSVVITALHNDKGDIIGFSKVTRDLTEKKIAEDKLNEYLLELQQQNKELERFAYIASHDLQEPLRKIRTFAELIEKDLDDKEAIVRYFSKIKESASRMSALIKSVLLYSRLAAQDDDREAVDLNDILEEVVNQYEFTIMDKQATIEAAKLPTIDGIALQLSQLFANLLGNALKFSSDAPLIEVSVSKVSDRAVASLGFVPHARDYHLVTFADNGIGFDPIYAQKIFAVFERLHARHEYPGTGIGLALCKRIMDNHQGFIRAEGAPGKGATFYLYFPVSE